MSRASGLHRLQRIDIDISESRSRLVDIQDILDDSADLSRAQLALSEAEKVFRDSQTATSRAEHAMGTQRDKIEATDGKLYGGRITNPKELEDLQHESISLKRHLSTLEDRLLDAMLVLEEAEGKFEAAQAGLARVEEDLATQHAALTQEREGLSAKLERLETEREVAAASVRDDDLSMYDKLRKDLGNVVVALIVETCCSACGLAIPPSIRQVARSDADLARCGQCGRILYGG